MLRSVFGDFYGNLTISDILIENKRDDEIVTPVLNVTFIIPENKRNNFSKLMENANFESSLNKTAVNLRKYLDVNKAVDCNQTIVNGNFTVSLKLRLNY